MHIAYLDESGDEQPLRTPDDPPVLVIGGVIVDAEHAKSLAWRFLQLKKEFNDSLIKDGVQLSDIVRFEVKGSELRRDIRSATRRNRRRAYGFLDSVVGLLAEEKASIIGEIYIKGEVPLSKWVYPEAVAAIADRFDHQLAAHQSLGMMVLDARTKWKNTPSVHRVTTSRFKSGGGRMQNLVESPTFGHSDSHIALQIADVVTSALLFPMACAGFCSCLIHNIHLNGEYVALRDRYGKQLKGLEYRYIDKGKWCGGIRVIDRMNNQPTRGLYTNLPLDEAALSRARRTKPMSRTATSS
ncbi:hypothetical protein BOH72_23425 [Mycobacterium sp. WY10]|nr:hypothetical protein BOH72_23425 [Mycobacterium sp. WY10]